jgi:hypothetical protein
MTMKNIQCMLCTGYDETTSRIRCPDVLLLHARHDVVPLPAAPACMDFAFNLSVHETDNCLLGSFGAVL